MKRTVIVAACLLTVGCGERLTKVSGVVTAKGTPVKFGTISFVPDGTGERAAAQIDDGKFDATTFSPGDGIKPGNYKVMIAAYKSLPEMGKPESGKPAIASKYFDAGKSGLTAKIEAGPPQTLKFDLDLP